MNKNFEKKENLEKLLKLLPHLIDLNENEWFKKRLYNEVLIKYYPQNSVYRVDEDSLLRDDEVNRIRAYMKLIDKKALNYGKVFYKDIKDSQLKKQLVSDFRLMKIALRGDDILEFGKFMAMQLENVYNYSLRKIDVCTQVKNNPNLYKAYPNPNKPTQPYNIFDNFVDKNNNDKKLESISLKSRGFFCQLYYKIKVYYPALDDIYFLRNKASHRGPSTPEDLNRLREIFDDFDIQYSNYFKNFEKLMRGLTDLY